MKRNNRQIRLIGLATAMVCALAGGQQTKPAPPHITSAEVPLYPPIARVANVEGTVHVKITTDGHRVTTAYAEDGPRILAAAAEKNARTWQFAPHEPTTLMVTYRYKLVTNLDAHGDNPRVLLRLPSEIEIDTLKRPPISDPPAKIGYFNPTVCELVSDPDKYAGKPIKVRAVLASGPEFAVLRDDTCQPVPASGKRLLATFSEDYDSESPLAKKLSKMLKTKQQAQVTVIGKFDDLGHATDHQNCCRYKLEVQQVLTVNEVKPSTSEINDEGVWDTNKGENGKVTGGWPSIRAKVLSREKYPWRCVSIATLAREHVEDEDSGRHLI